MRIMVFVSQILDAEERVRIRDRAVDLSASKLVVDPMDEYGVEEALRLREAGADAEIIAVGIGSAILQEALRAVLSLGADRAIHVTSTTRVDAMAAGAILAAVAREEAADLIFIGGQQASLDSQAIGAAAAEHLDWPQVTWVSALKLESRTLTGKHDVDAGKESFVVDLPAVITTQQGLNEPRYPTLPNIVKSRKKEIRSEPIERFAVTVKTRTITEDLQTKERMHQVIDGKDAAAAALQLVEYLKREAKVIP